MVYDLGGGEEGIRTLDTLITYTPLAGERLQPLGHLSARPKPLIISSRDGKLGCGLVCGFSQIGLQAGECGPIPRA